MSEWTNNQTIDAAAVGLWVLLTLALSIWAYIDAHRKNRNAVVWAVVVLLCSIPAWIVLRQLPTASENQQGPPAWRRSQRRLRIGVCILLTGALIAVLKVDHIERTYGELQASILAEVFADVFGGSAEAEGNAVQIAVEGQSATIAVADLGPGLVIAAVALGAWFGLAMQNGQPIVTVLLMGWGLLAGYIADAGRVLLIMEQTVAGLDPGLLLWPCFGAVFLVTLMALTFVEHVCPHAFAKPDMDKDGLHSMPAVSLGEGNYQLTARRF